LAAENTAKSGTVPAWVELHDGQVWWAEHRPAEGGRVVLLREENGSAVEVLGPGWNVRNRVHEYGGRPWVVLDGGRVAFTHWDDQRIYLTGAGEPQPITPDPLRPSGLRYSDLRAGTNGEVWCVREELTGDKPTDVRRDLVAVSPAGAVRPLA